MDIGFPTTSQTPLTRLFQTSQQKEPPNDRA